MSCRDIDLTPHQFARKGGVYDQINLAKFKSLALMVSRDENRLMLLDYVEKRIRMRVSFDRVHDRQLLSGAIHPSGLYCLLGFQENLTFYAITDSELRFVSIFEVNMVRHLVYFCCVSYVRNSISMFEKELKLVRNLSGDRLCHSGLLYIIVHVVA